MSAPKRSERIKRIKRIKADDGEVHGVERLAVSPNNEPIDWPLCKKRRYLSPTYVSQEITCKECEVEYVAMRLIESS